ncbi:MAG: hypothetical protein U0136_17060 [Bdellovibrionota bacterium]
MAILWLATANHCFVVNAFAASPTELHRCCEEKKMPTGSHERSSDQACCQLFSQSVRENADLLADPVSALTPVVFSIALASYLPVAELAKASAVVSAHAPPGEPERFVSSLTLASNAPPSTF